MDEVDWASQLETQQRDAAISRVVDRHRVTQLLIDDEVCCRDCYDPIPAGRLEACPEAAYCVGCMEIMEREGGLCGS